MSKNSKGEESWDLVKIRRKRKKKKEIVVGFLAVVVLTSCALWDHIAIMMSANTITMTQNFDTFFIVLNRKLGDLLGGYKF